MFGMCGNDSGVVEQDYISKLQITQNLVYACNYTEKAIYQVQAHLFESSLLISVYAYGFSSLILAQQPASPPPTLIPFVINSHQGKLTVDNQPVYLYDVENPRATRGKHCVSEKVLTSHNVMSAYLPCVSQQEQ